MSQENRFHVDLNTEIRNGHLPLAHNKAHSKLIILINYHWSFCPELKSIERNRKGTKKLVKDRRFETQRKGEYGYFPL